MSSVHLRRGAFAFLSVSVGAAVAFWSAACAPAALAAGAWPWPVGSVIAVPYGATWTDASGRACTHGGADIAAEPGAEVRSCSAGTVSFKGRVPGSAGGTVLAVTVSMPDGLRATYMPLESSGLEQGQAVGPGSTIGRLAASGDGSTAQPHLHLSVRRGETPLDPAAFLAPVPAAGGSAAMGPSAQPLPQAGAGAPAVPLESAPAVATGAGGVTAPSAARAAQEAGSRAARSQVVSPLPAVSAADPGAAMRDLAPVESPASAVSLAAVSAPVLGGWNGRAAHLPPASSLPSPGTLWRSLQTLAQAGGGFGLRLIAALFAAAAMRMLLMRRGGMLAALVPVTTSRQRPSARG